MSLLFILRFGGSMSKDFDIRLADMTYIDSCVEILKDSELGKVYFSDHKKATAMLSYAVSQDNVYVALDENGKCLGFIYYMKKGVFGSYPYLHIVAVKEEYRGHGIGKQPDFYKQGINCYLMMKRRG